MIMRLTKTTDLHDEVSLKARLPCTMSLETSVSLTVHQLRTEVHTQSKRHNCKPHSARIPYQRHSGCQDHMARSTRRTRRHNRSTPVLHDRREPWNANKRKLHLHLKGRCRELTERLAIGTLVMDWAQPVVLLSGLAVAAPSSPSRWVCQGGFEACGSRDQQLHPCAVALEASLRACWEVCLVAEEAAGSRQRQGS
eukprot:CAMPEP_0194545562 /NCGR_PEP_ID=MMETSP0253-20130528/89390_1 /TAXON_ID=2966 /ORGANISM="Noctiluca scintillans" /LENGTH=195 /DNA_ID=CAMNT_0039392565 /DNA_START=156 /DNA_END=743 /DNA_ORIENTATION=-